MNSKDEDNSILQRILKKSRSPELMDILCRRLSFSDLHSLLLHVYKKRTVNRTPGEVLNQYERDRFVQPAHVAPQDLLDIERLSYNLLPSEFMTIELSPVCPLGSVSVLGPVDQKNVLTTIRNSEVTADSTNVMALESARLRRLLQKKDSRSAGRIRLCASHRLLRTQVFSEDAAFPHFKILSLTTAGRDEGNLSFEVESLIEQIDFYLCVLNELDRKGYGTHGIRLVFFLYDKEQWESCRDVLGKYFAAHYPTLRLDFRTGEQDGCGYYKGLRFQIFALNRQDREYFLVDGGLTDWTQKLLSSAKERFLISGMGTERFLVCFGEPEKIEGKGGGT